MMAILPVSRLWEGEMLGLCVEGTPVLVANVDGEIVAYRDTCAHQAVALSEGSLTGHVLACRAHGWSFDVRTGQGINPAAARLVRLPVEVRDGQICVDPRGAR